MFFSGNCINPYVQARQSQGTWIFLWLLSKPIGSENFLSYMQFACANSTVDVFLYLPLSAANGLHGAATMSSTHTGEEKKKLD